MEYNGHKYGIKILGSLVAIEPVDLFGNLSKYDYTITEYMTCSNKYHDYDTIINSLGENECIQAHGWKLKKISFFGCGFGHDGNVLVEDPFGRTCHFYAILSFRNYSMNSDVAIKLCIEKFLEFASQTFSSDYYEILHESDTVNANSTRDIGDMLSQLKLTETFLQKAQTVKDCINQINPEQKDFYMQKLAEACKKIVKKELGIELMKI